MLLDLVGDGPSRAECQRLIEACGMSQAYRLHGWLERRALNSLYTAAHFVVLPSTCSEGWPKVLSEGMAHGAVPIASAVSAIPDQLRQIGTGAAVNQGTPSAKLVIGARTVVGSGAVVVKDCDEDAVYVGIPARRIK